MQDVDMFTMEVVTTTCTYEMHNLQRTTVKAFYTTKKFNRALKSPVFTLPVKELEAIFER